MAGGVPARSGSGVRQIRQRGEFAEREVRELTLRADVGAESLDLVLPGIAHRRTAGPPTRYDFLAGVVLAGVVLSIAARRPGAR